MSKYEDYKPEINYPDEYNIADDPIDNGQGDIPPYEPEKKPRKKPADKKKKPASKSADKKKKPVDPENPGVIESLRQMFDSRTLRLLLGLTFGALAAWLTVGFISFLSACVADQSMVSNTPVGNAEAVTNMAGEGGARVADFLINGCFGVGSVVIIFWLIAMTLKLFGAHVRFKTVNFTIKCIIALVAISLIVGLTTIGFDNPVNWGGLHGRYVNEQVIHFLGWIGAAILCCFILAVFVLICLRDVVKWILAVKRRHDEKRAAIAAEKAAKAAKLRELEEMERLEREEAVAAVTAGSAGGVVENDPGNGDDVSAVTFGNDDLELAGTYGEIPEEDLEEYVYPNTDSDPEINNGTQVDADCIHKNGGVANGGEGASDAKPEDAQEGEPGEVMAVNVNTISQTDKKAPMHDSPGRLPYKFPPYELMREGNARISVDQDEQIENEERIRKTLLDFGINITSIEATVGPTVTLYEIVPDKGVKIAKIRNLVDDIALSLAATGVRIIAPIPGRGTVGIEVANKDPQTVSMRTVIKSKAYQESKAKLPIALGCTISNEVYITDLAKMPHLLVAGATGQGKSVGLNAIITSLLYSKSPDELKFVMIDPKMVEFSFYEKIEKFYLAKLPGDDNPIITDMSKVVATLSSLCVEMDDRYQLLRAAHAKNIEEYNPKYINHQLNPDNGHRYLPYIVVVVDEFSDLIMTAGKEVEMPIARLAQKARAVGIHVIIATQRPSTNVITGIIKANFPARIAFKVGSGVDSKTILDCTGAQQLIGRGDMLVSHNSELVRVQCAFMDTPEVEEVCDHIESQPYPRGAYILPEPIVNGDDDDDYGRRDGGGERDPLFEEVARTIINSSTASTSSLQRRYSIGYNRAGKIMDQLEAAGIVGPSRDGRPRSVLVDAMTLETILQSN